MPLASHAAETARDDSVWLVLFDCVDASGPKAAERRAGRSIFQRDSKIITAFSVAFFALLGCAAWL